GMGKMRIAAAAGTAMISLLAASSEGMAQQKAIKECQREWLASKAANLADGVTKQAYLDLCRVGGVFAVRAATFVASSQVRAAASTLSSPSPAAMPTALSTRPANGNLCE